MEDAKLFNRLLYKRGMSGKTLIPRPEVRSGLRDFQPWCEDACLCGVPVVGPGLSVTTPREVKLGKPIRCSAEGDHGLSETRGLRLCWVIQRA